MDGKSIIANVPEEIPDLITDDEITDNESIISNVEKSVAVKPRFDCLICNSNLYVKDMKKHFLTTKCLNKLPLFKDILENNCGCDITFKNNNEKIIHFNKVHKKS